MDFHCWNEEGCTVELDERERQAYIDYVQKKNPGQVIEYIIVRLDGEFADLEYKVKPKEFQRIRRITGYLTGTVDTWNDAKQDELKDRVKHK
mgnify:FL=1